MAEKKKYSKFTTPRGVFIYPKLVEPDTKFDSDGTYAVKVALDADADSTKAFIKKLEAERAEFIKEFKAEDKKNVAKVKKANMAELYEEETDDEGEETGRLLFRFKLKAIVRPKNSDAFEQKPRLFDGLKQPITEAIKMWSGTEGKISGEIFPFYMASTKTIGLSLRCKAAQILKLVSGGDGGTAEDYGFEEDEDGFDGSDAPTSQPVPDADSEVEGDDPDF